MRKLKRLYCKYFNCNWKYGFSVSNSAQKRINIKACRRCGDVQNYKPIPQLDDPDNMQWVSFVFYTDEGAKDYWKEMELTKERD